MEGEVAMGQSELPAVKPILLLLLPNQLQCFTMYNCFMYNAVTQAGTNTFYSVPLPGGGGLYHKREQ